MSAETLTTGQHIKAVGGKYEVRYDLGNLSKQELKLCVAIIALLCEPRLDRRRRELAEGGTLTLNADGSICVTPNPVNTPGCFIRN